MINFKNKKIAVVNNGGKIESDSNAKFFEKQGARVTVFDQTKGEDFFDSFIISILKRKLFRILFFAPGCKLHQR